MGIMKKKKKAALGEITMASTSDVAFLLLIFFIVTTIFAAEQGLTLVLPGKQQETDTVKVKESNIATIYVQEDNSITLDKKPIVVNHIKQAIEDRLLANPKLVVLLIPGERNSIAITAPIMTITIPTTIRMNLSLPRFSKKLAGEAIYLPPTDIAQAVDPALYGHLFIKGFGPLNNISLQPGNWTRFREYHHLFLLYNPNHHMWSSGPSNIGRIGRSWKTPLRLNPSLFLF